MTEGKFAVTLSFLFALRADDRHGNGAHAPF